METIEFNGTKYPAFQASGNAARFVMPFAEEVLRGKGLDIGCNRQEWSLRWAKMIDVTIDDEWDAYNLPTQDYDFIFSSHCLEHLPDWVGVLQYWMTRVSNGIIFLYLPDYSQEYWRPWNNRRHVNIIEPKHLEDFCVHHKDRIHWFKVTGTDLNNSFTCVMKLRHKTCPFVPYDNFKQKK
jgi:SAM-dependent methyltransferase